MRKFVLPVLAACVLQSAAQAAVPLQTAAGDAAFAAAQEAYARGDRLRLAQAVARLGNHPLAPWGEHFRLLQRLDEGGADDREGPLAAFIERHAGSYLAEKTRLDWLKWLMKNERWSAARRLLEQLERPDGEARCRRIEVDLRLGEWPAEAVRTVADLLAAEAPLPDACRPAFDLLAERGDLPVEAVWQRLRRQLALGKMKGARQLAGWLPAGEAPVWRNLEAVNAHPAHHLTRLAGDALQTRAGRELTLFAVARLARTDARVAATHWSAIENQFADTDRGAAWGQLAYWAALNHQPVANAWFDRAVSLGGALDEDQHAWRVRAALRSEDWPRVDSAIVALPAALAGQAEWIYWHAKARAALGDDAAAHALWQGIAGRPHFYGLLAGETIGQPFVPPAAAAAVTADELAAARARAGLVRGLALIGNDMRLEGLREWNWQLAGMTDRELLAAAEFARREKVIDRAIFSADRTREEHDYRQRYPLPFFSQVEPHTRAVGLDPAWVYGLMRQESRFIMDAKSSAGAKGLMQLMPATAKWVAKKIGMTHYHPGKVADMDTNVVLGTHYLRMVMDSLDNHPVLASAAYNAGPGRARKWRGERALAGAIYAETIPFNETRDYVKKVLANAAIYAALLGRPAATLNDTLGVVRPRGFVDGTGEDLP